MFTFHRFVEVNIGITNIKSLSLLRRSLGSKPGKEHTRIRGEVLAETVVLRRWESITG